MWIAVGYIYCSNNYIRGREMYRWAASVLVASCNSATIQACLNEHKIAGIFGVESANRDEN